MKTRSSGPPLHGGGGSAQGKHAARNASTLIELLVVSAIIAILAGMLLPVLSRAKAKGQSAVCQSNLKQLMLGWTLYAADSEDRLAGSISVNWVNQRGSWVLGNAKQDRTSSNIMSGVVFRYNPAVGAYRCPADRSTVIGDQGLLRTRSYTLNGWMNSSRMLACLAVGVPVVSRTCRKSFRRLSTRHRQELSSSSTSTKRASMMASGIPIQAHWLPPKYQC